MRGIASLIVALCLLAAGGLRAHDPGELGGRDDRAPQLSAGHGVLASLAPRREGGSHELRLAAFPVPASPAVPPPPRVAVVVCDARPPWIVSARLAARSARGPPLG